MIVWHLITNWCHACWFLLPGYDLCKKIYLGMIQPDHIYAFRFCTSIQTYIRAEKHWKWETLLYSVLHHQRIKKTRHMKISVLQCTFGLVWCGRVYSCCHCHHEQRDYHILRRHRWHKLQTWLSQWVFTIVKTFGIIARTIPSHHHYHWQSLLRHHQHNNYVPNVHPY